MSFMAWHCRAFIWGFRRKISFFYTDRYALPFLDVSANDFVGGRRGGASCTIIVCR